ncbi:MAG: 23S rRNA pseudouridine(955/2504/2580) synthase RluC [Methylomonas sp.]|nr:23S rRNA pseudouridine(955/2504/2580) synthase RluC [Methylomonas sp.]PPD21323.1 MAG: 23S rRNA pseudouridine(955/2504/2580) synthase RluC [Methylomonas sp.]PPD26945.1 MAG: 23S rRNA pseudouridine(955/2504/2580) synthase RluC [Methylomonas sp.]PPD38876.1 MAG: 23S rRNA pseudouridine(955/2504/2580) synthase RluC [Methylomonas sp.]PPD41740.1 MAG: 23S rRNA pseudouridine(955/2504/2580) synthase RluC [Methylomonas sp.]
MKSAADQPNPPVQWLEITDAHAGQRLDNFLISTLKGVPKTRIYRIVRKGEVRVNKGRVDVGYKLAAGDVVRIPPVRVAERADAVIVQPALLHGLEHHILFEDEGFIVLNKPSGFAVHGGSGINAGVIEALRQIRPQQKFLELVHRLDKETSGCLLIAKKRAVLKLLHELFRGDGIQKTYLALLAGQFKRTQQTVDVPLLKNVGQAGERRVTVSQAGKSAETVFTRLKLFQAATLVHAAPRTGRTHQIRVHAAWLGHPIIGDDRYGENDVNKAFRARGYKRMFLHAEQLRFLHPATGVALHFVAPLPNDLQQLLDRE